MLVDIHNSEILVLSLSNLLLELDDLIKESKGENPMLKEFFDMAYTELENLQKQIPSDEPIKKPKWK